MFFFCLVGFFLIPSPPFSVRELSGGGFHSLLLQAWFVFPVPKWFFSFLPGVCVGVGVREKGKDLS